MEQRGKKTAEQHGKVDIVQHCGKSSHSDAAWKKVKKWSSREKEDIH